MLSFSATLIATLLASATIPVIPVNIIDGKDDRGALATLGPKLGLSAAEMARIRAVSGHVACLKPKPAIGSGALFLTDGQILTAAHMFFDGASHQSDCFFRPQTAGSQWVPLLADSANARFGAVPSKPGSNNDWAVVRLAKRL
ncbi:MAG TPA: hypothetical protein VIK30_06030, partial [Polyangia bacterium]